MLMTILGFFFHPRGLFAHLVGGGLLYSLFKQGHSKSSIAFLVLLEEVLGLLLWVLIPNSFATIISLAITIYAYEKISGPRLEIQDNAVFLAEKDVLDMLQGEGNKFKVSVSKLTDGRLTIGTDLQYAIYSSSFWGVSNSSGAIDLNDVSGIQDGADNAVKNSVTNKGGQVENCFHLQLGVSTTVTFIAVSKVIKDLWVSAFKDLFGSRFDEYYDNKDCFSNWVKQQFIDATQDKDGKLDLDGSVLVFKQMGRQTDKAYIKDIFQTFAKISKSSKGDHVDVDNFKKFFELAAKRPEIHQVFERIRDYKKGELVVPPTRLQTFMKDEQKEDASMLQCKTWIKQCEMVLPPYSFCSIGFTNFMLSEEQRIFKRECRQIYQDMNQPLTHYFIATSHNTYLLKDQFKGKSSVDAYVSAFQRGCKCVELDCWNGPNNEPIIYHGHTLTTKISFRDVIQAINDHAFDVSPYPVILSFENHCDIEQQKVMAQHIVKILGDKLYTYPIPDNETSMPSPEALKGFVIVKAKKLKKDEVGEDEDDDDDFSDVEDDDEADGEIDENKNIPDSPTSPAVVNGEEEKTPSPAASPPTSPAVNGDGSKEEGKKRDSKFGTLTRGFKNIMSQKKEPGKKKKVPTATLR